MIESQRARIHHKRAESRFSELDLTRNARKHLVGGMRVTHGVPTVLEMYDAHGEEAKRIRKEKNTQIYWAYDWVELKEGQHYPTWSDKFASSVETSPPGRSPRFFEHIHEKS